MRKLMACLVAPVATAAANANPVVYSQPSDWPGSGFSGWTSDWGAFNSNFNLQDGFQTFDDFRLTNATSVAGFRWTMFSWDFLNAANNPISPDSLAWLVDIWSDAAGQPGTPLRREFVSVSQTFLGFANFAGSLVPVYEFGATLATPFDADANTTYWFSPLSYSTDLNPVVSWMSGQGPNGYSYQFGIDNGFYTFREPRFGDRAFVVLATPEPISLVMFGGLIVGGGLVARKRLAKKAA